MRKLSEQDEWKEAAEFYRVEVDRLEAVLRVMASCQSHMEAMKRIEDKLDALLGLATPHITPYEPPAQ